MKYITLIIGLLVVGCLTPQERFHLEWKNSSEKQHEPHVGRMTLAQTTAVNGPPDQIKVVDGLTYALWDDHIFRSVLIFGVNEDGSRMVLKDYKFTIMKNLNEEFAP